MTTETKTQQQFAAENEELRRQLAEAKETIEAIRHGSVDALLVDGSEGPQVYMLSGADQPYRVMVEEMQEGAVTLRDDGIIVYCNKQIGRLLRTPYQNLLGQPFRNFLTPASLSLFEALFERSRKETSRGEVCLVAADGAQVPAYLALRLLSADGLAQISMVIGDLTEQKRYQEIVATEVFATSVLDQAQDAIVVCDASGKIIRANQAAERLCGVNPLLQPFDASFPLRRTVGPIPSDVSLAQRDVKMPLFPLASTVQFFRGVEATFTRTDGVRVDLLLSVSQLLDFEQKLLGNVVTMTDITERKLTENALRQSEEQYRLAIKATNDAIWDINLTTGTVRWNDAYATLFGRPPEAGDSWQWWIEHIHPEDRERTVGGLRAAIDGRESSWTCEYRFMRADGTWADILDRAYVARDASDKAWRVVGAMLDLTERKRAETDLRESRARLAWVLENTGVGTWFNTLPLGQLNWDDQTRRLFFVPPGAESTVELFWSRVHTDDRESTRLAVEKAIRERTLYEIDHRAVNPDTGEVRWIRSVGQATYAADGTPTRFDGINYDITERKRAEEELERERKQLLAVIESLDEAVGVWNTDGSLVLINDATAKLYGLEMKEQMLRHLSDYADVQVRTMDGCELPPEEWPPSRVLRGETFSNWELEQYIPSINKRFIGSNSGRPARDANGKVILGVTSVRDITERKRAEEAIQQSQKTFSELIERSPFGTYVVNAQFRIAMMNAASQDGAFRNVQPVVGRDFAEAMRILWPEPIAAEIIGHFRHTLETGEPYYSPRFTNPRHDVEIVESYEWELHRMTLPDGQYGVICYYYDSTKLREAEAAVLESRERERQRAAELQAMLQTAPIAIWIAHDPECRRITGNTTADRLLCSPRSANISASAPPGEATVTYKVFHGGVELRPDQMPAQVATATGRPVVGDELELIFPDGRRIHLIESAVPLFHADGSIRGAIIAGQDISERKRAEEELQSRESFYRQTLESIPGMVFTTRPDGYCDYQSQQWVNYTGVPMSEHVGDGWNKLLHPDDRPRAFAAWYAAVEGRAPYDLEYRVRRHDGQYEWFKVIGRPIRDASGQIVRWFGVAANINELKQAEEALAVAKAAAEAANEAKGRFLANMSHELRTPMNAILGMIDVALPKAIDPTVQDCLQTAKGSADLLLTILNDLLDSAKIEAGKLELESAPFSLRRMLDQITRVLSVRASEKGLNFRSRMPDDTPDVVVGDRMRLQQILLNLAGNAIKFTDRGEVEIGLNALSQDGEACLEFAVRDTGIGIPPFGLEHLFQPFAQLDATMARRFGGTGLGLSICKSLVEMMGGRIWVESQMDKGSTFYFTVCLPLAKELPEDFETPTAPPAAKCNQLRILLVEDNPANQKVAAYILQDRGHIVEVAADGEKAILLTQEHRYDAILMDVQMPGMNGLEATAAIRKRENEGGSRTPIIAMTAHAMKEDRDRCLAAGMDGYLSKPINAQEMIGLVESLAGGATASNASAASTTPGPAEPVNPPAAAVFDPELALKRCFNNRNMLKEMIQCFFDDVGTLFPQMHTALEKGDLAEVGCLGHRLKGTVICLGAEPAKEAALRVERFHRGSGEQAEAEEAVRALQRECMMLKTALFEYPLAAEPKQSN